MSETRKPLLTVEQFREMARPTSTHIDTEDVRTYIRECEDAYIIPAISYRQFKGAVECEDSTPWDASFDDTFKTTVFLDGGEYVQDEGTEKEQVQWCSGVRKALAYFVYARMQRADGNIISRAGAMRHRDERADHTDDSKLRQYNDTMAMAERYLAECVAYLKTHLKDDNIKKIHTTRAKITAIGD